VLDRFPGAEIVGVRGPKEAALDVPAAADEALPPAEEDGLGENWVRDDGVD
jgi:hypothetical protein